MSVRRLWLVFATALLAAASGAAPLRVGLFVGRGARSNGCAAWVRLMTSSPDILPVFLDGAAVRGGALKGLDVLVMPGGHSFVEAKELGRDGREAIRRFVRDGGGYFGTCAGCSLTLNEPQEERMRLIPFSRHQKTPRGGSDALTMKVSSRGEELTGIKAGDHTIRYHNGPLLVPTKPLDGAEFEVIGRWNCDLCERGTNSVSMSGFPALVCGRHGKGRVFVTSGHPEHFPRSRDFVVGGFRYITGVEPSFAFRPRSRRALSVGLYTPAMAGVETAKALVALEREADLDVVHLQDDDITAGRLDHVDALVLPDGDSERYDAIPKEAMALIDGFGERGGVTVGWGAGAYCLPRRNGRVVAGAQDAAAALRTPPSGEETGRHGLFPPDVKTVGIVSMSGIIPEEALDRGTNLIARCGYGVRVMPNVAGPDVAAPEVRARLFEEAWLSPDIDILLFSRGGVGAADVVPLIDWEKLRGRDMRVVGFSDVTLVLNAMLAKGAGHPYSGPMLSSFSKWDGSSRSAFAAALCGGALPPIMVRALRPGTARGLPMGGHVTRMHWLFRNGLSPSAAGRVVFLECTARHVFGTVRANLEELRDGGFFDGAAAVVFADFRHRGEDRRLLEAFLPEFAATLGCPVFAGYPYGHCGDSLTLDFRREVEIGEDGVVSWREP